MKKTINLDFGKLTKYAAVAIAASCVFSACTKTSTSVNTGTVLPPQAITGTVLNGGNIKGVMLGGLTYTVNGDLTVLPADTLVIQPGATINVTGNHAFYVQGVIQSLGTQALPITFTTTGPQQPGQWGGFQADSAKGVTFTWTKILWAGGPDSTGSVRATIDIRSKIYVDIEDCWFIGGQDNGISIFSQATAKIWRNTFYGGGTTDGDCIDFHEGSTGSCAYNVGWGQAGSGIKIYTSTTVPIVQTNILAYNNTWVDIGFRRGAGEPGRGIIVDAYAKAKVYNNLYVNNYWSMDVTPSADYANTQYGNNYFYVTVDSLRKFMYPLGERGAIQSSDIIDSVHLGANDPMFVGYATPPNPSLRIIPSNFDFHLKPGSPALGKGNPAYNNDIGAYVTDTSNGKGNRH